MCGSTSSQNSIEQQQQQFMTTLQGESGTVFGQDSALYNDLIAQFKPIFEAGPDQQGYTKAELAQLNTSATTGVTQNYQAAEKAIREQDAAEGGGNEYVPSGQEKAIEAGVTESAAGQESTEQLQIEQASEEQGRANWLAATQGMLEAPSVMSEGASFAGQATNAGTAAANTANQIAQENQSWMGALGGMLGTAFGSTGGFGIGNAFAPTG
jgi:hypothetical protein